MSPNGEILEIAASRGSGARRPPWNRVQAKAGPGRGSLRHCRRSIAAGLRDGEFPISVEGKLATR
jgi:hypothetical protein